MVITVTTRAESEQPVELATVKTELGITDSSADTVLTSLINSVSEMFARKLGRDFWRETVVEKLPGAGGVFLDPERWPIESITSITEGISAADTVTAADYSVAGRVKHRDRIYREDGWMTSARPEERFPSAGGQVLDYVLTHVAGWLMPSDISTWAASTAYALKAWARPLTGSPSLYLFECTTAGTSDSSEPTWPSTVAGTVTDGSVVWTAREARELPDELQLAAKLQVAAMYKGGLEVPAGIASESDAVGSITYRDGAVRDLLPQLEPILAGWSSLPGWQS